jgi:predicted RNA-binding protein with PUA-like domain
MRYWLMKTEPESFSIDDLERVGVEPWDGIRNYMARNFMRDDMKVGDQVLFYHSSAKPPGVAGLAEIASGAYPDHTQFDPKSNYHDPKSDPDNPTWLLVDVKFVEKLPRFVPLDELRTRPELDGMVLLNRSRLSVQPVDRKHFDFIVKLAGKAAPI